MICCLQALLKRHLEKARAIMSPQFSVVMEKKSTGCDVALLWEALSHMSSQRVWRTPVRFHVRFWGCSTSSAHRSQRFLKQMLLQILSSLTNMERHHLRVGERARAC